MALDLTLPPNTRVDGDPNHTTDHNTIVNALQAAETAINTHADHTISDVVGLQTEIDSVVDGLADKSDIGHTHTSANISGTLTLAQLPPNTLFVINYVSGAWKFEGATITARPTARSDLRMWAVGGTTPPNFAVTHDMHSPETV